MWAGVACLGVLAGAAGAAEPATGDDTDLLAPAQRLTAAAHVLALPMDVLPGSPQGVEYILGALGKRAGIAEVATAALSALARVTDEQPPGSDGSPPLLVTAALEGGAAAGIVGALKEHEGEAAVVGAACASLYALGRHDVGQKAAGQLGAVELVVAALGRHGSDGGVVGLCAHALMHLTVDGDNKKRFREAPGGAQSLVGALRTHAQSLRVARTVSGALNNAAAGDPANKAALVRAGALEAVTQALGTHRRDASAAEQSCGALAVLAMADGAHLRVPKAGSVEAAVTALEAHSGQRKPKKGSGRAPRAPSPRAVAACSRALASLAWTNPDVQRLARDSLAPEALRAAQAAFPEDAQVKKWTAKALEKITDPMIEGALLTCVPASLPPRSDSLPPGALFTTGMFDGLLSGEFQKQKGEK